MQSIKDSLPIAYDWATFTVSTGQTNYDVKSNVAALFANAVIAKHVSIVFDQEISIRFNSTLMPAIVLTSGDSPFQTPSDFLEIKNIYITNSSGSTVTMKVLLW